MEVETGGIHHHLVLAFCLLSILVVVLLSILAYLVTNRGRHASNKFNILDNLGKTSTLHRRERGRLIEKYFPASGREREERGESGAEQFTTRFQSSSSYDSDSSVPPAVMRSLRNIRKDGRRDVVVDIAGRNNVR